MHYIPKHFKAEEIFSKKVIKAHTKNDKLNPNIWRIMDDRVLWTADKLRDLFGPIKVNDYSWGGSMQQRGYRHPIELIDIDYYKKKKEFKTTFSSFTSQHCFGRALDTTIKNYFAEEIRQYIINNKKMDEFKYITAIEKKVNWLHFDTRNYTDSKKGLLIF